MRLPDFLTKLSPIGETLEAIYQGTAALEAEAKQKNDQLTVSTAEEALSRWEAEYSLADGTGSPVELRRARILAAMTGGQTLTVERLAALAVTVGGADSGQVEENFSAWQATLCALYQGRLPADTAALREAVERLKPAHLAVDVVSQAWLPVPGGRYLALSGGMFMQLQSRNSE